MLSQNGVTTAGDKVLDEEGSLSMSTYSNEMAWRSRASSQSFHLNYEEFLLQVCSKDMCCCTHKPISIFRSDDFEFRFFATCITQEIILLDQHRTMVTKMWADSVHTRVCWYGELHGSARISFEQEWCIWSLQKRSCDGWGGEVIYCSSGCRSRDRGGISLYSVPSNWFEYAQN